MDESTKGTWCREHGVFLAEPSKWQMSATCYAKVGRWRRRLSGSHARSRHGRRVLDACAAHQKIASHLAGDAAYAYGTECSSQHKA
jgi:hypothetical protein